jgi:hypothetical protein
VATIPQVKEASGPLKAQKSSDIDQGQGHIEAYVFEREKKNFGRKALVVNL